MKQVYSTASEVAHIWAQQGEQTSARCKNVFFNDSTIYSYGAHYPLGVIATNKKGERAAIINAAGYSNTTTKHIYEAKRATSHYLQLIVEDTQSMKNIIDAVRWNQPERIIYACGEAIIARVAGYESTLRNDTKKRKAATLEQWKNDALADCARYVAVADWFGVKLDAKTRAALKRLSGKSVADAKAAAVKAQAAIERKREKLRKEVAKANAEFIARAIPAWLDGIDHINDGERLRNTADAIRAYHDGVVMRIKGDEVETSHGARFPLSHGLKALPLIRRIIASGADWHRNGQTIHLGHYQIDSISAAGVIKAGCHTLHASEVERIAKTINA